MSINRQLAVATRGFRGNIGEKFYVNESMTLDEGIISIDLNEGTLNVNILETVPVAAVEVISVEVSSIDIEGTV